MDSKLPNSIQAIIPSAKIVDYLLSPFHSSGKFKAKFFFKFGFRVDEWQTLAEALRQHAQEHPVTKIEPNDQGTRFIVEGSIRSPDGRHPEIRSVWFIEKGEEIPRLVTAYPL